MDKAKEQLTHHKKSALKGNFLDAYFVGTVYQIGWNVEVDKQEALSWFKLALKLYPNCTKTIKNIQELQE